MLITPNDYFDEIFCINLNKATERWDSVSKRFRREGIFVTRFEGVDKEQEWVQKNFDKYVKNRQGIIKKLGRFAVWQAFLRLFEYVLTRNDIKTFLLFEDDVLFHKDFKVLFHNAVSKIPNNWGMWYLGATQTRWTNLDQSKINTFYQPNGFTYGMFGVAFKRDFIEDYILLYNKGLMNNDHFFSKIPDKKRMYISWPYIVGHSTGLSYNADYNITKELTQTKLKYFYYDENIYT